MPGRGGRRVCGRSNRRIPPRRLAVVQRRLMEMKQLWCLATAAAIAAALALFTPSAFATASPRANCVGHDASILATSFGGIPGITDLAHTGQLGHFTVAEANLP